MLSLVIEKLLLGFLYRELSQVVLVKVALDFTNPVVLLLLTEEGRRYSVIDVLYDHISRE